MLNVTNDELWLCVNCEQRLMSIMLVICPSSLAFILWMKGIDGIHKQIKEVNVVILTWNMSLLKRRHHSFQRKRLLCLPAHTRKQIFGEYVCSIWCLVERWIAYLSVHTSSHPLIRRTVVLTYWVKRLKRWLLNVLAKQDYLMRLLKSFEQKLIET